MEINGAGFEMFLVTEDDAISQIPRLYRSLMAECNLDIWPHDVMVQLKSLYTCAKVVDCCDREMCIVPQVCCVAPPRPRITYSWSYPHPIAKQRHSACMT